MRKTRKNRGFSLIELLMVISIIGLISGVVLAALGDARTRARNSQRIQNTETIAKALQTATTGTINQFPYSWGQSMCLGDGYCYLGTSPDADLSTYIKKYISGEVIPVDPYFKNGPDGYSYGYNSNYAPPPSTQRGTYLFWLMEGRSSQKCGRGDIWIANSSSYTNGITSYGCRLHLGPPTTSFVQY